MNCKPKQQHDWLLVFTFYWNSSAWILLLLIKMKSGLIDRCIKIYALTFLFCAFDHTFLKMFIFKSDSWAVFTSVVHCVPCAYSIGLHLGWTQIEEKIKWNIKKRQRKETQNRWTTATKRKIKNHKFGQHVFYKLNKETEWKRIKQKWGEIQYSTITYTYT